MRSLITLKALTYAPTGGIVAAPTTSLPEWIGSVRNWDYRYCWLRDATLTLPSLTVGGYDEEALAWRDWLLRAAAGDPEDLQIMYGAAGERRLTEFTLDWLDGYEGSTPVRVGNAASEQFQLDVYGEVLATLLQHPPAASPTTRCTGTRGRSSSRCSTRSRSLWRHPDEGIWEVRGPAPALHPLEGDGVVGVRPRGGATSRSSGSTGPVDRWRTIRDEIHDQICDEAWDDEIGAFTQAYGSKQLDAAVLMMAIVGFLPGTDPRIVGTVEAIERTLLKEGFVARYETSPDGAVDGLPAGEGAFLPCSFWLADNLALIGRTDDAVALFERLLGLANDVGLLAEEYDGGSGPPARATSPRRSPTCAWSTPPRTCRSMPCAGKDSTRTARSTMTARSPRCSSTAPTPKRLAAFWCDVLGWKVMDRDDGDGDVEIGDGERRGSTLLFLPVPGTEDDQEPHPPRREGRPTATRPPRSSGSSPSAAHARQVDIGQGDVSWVVLADPEGNEFCVLRRPAGPLSSTPRARRARSARVRCSASHPSSRSTYSAGSSFGVDADVQIHEVHEDLAPA